MIEIPRRLRCNVEEDDDPRRHAWLATLPSQIAQLAAGWSLVLGEPLLAGGQCAWVAPARDRAGRELVLKAGWRHPEAEHECDDWAESFERDFDTDDRGLEPALAHDAIALLHELPRSAGDAVLLCTDLHAENVLAADREPWLAIDPKPFIGDPAYDAIQHMLNCDARLANDPVALAHRMADLLDLDPNRVKLWLFARCAQEALNDPTIRTPAALLAP